MEPRMIRKKSGSLSLTCNHCDLSRSPDDFLDVKPFYFKDGKFPVCNSCLKEIFIELEWNWDQVDRLCQGINIPFVPIEFEKLQQMNGDNVLPIYINMFNSLEYASLDWKMYQDKYMEIKRKGLLDMEVPSVRDSYFDDLRLRWGNEYDEEALLYLENLFNGMLSSQNINGALQTDQAQKLCKISWNIDERIRGDIDFDKLMGSYDKLSKIADFTPKNVRSDSDFSSMGEVVAWLEKRNWINPHYTDAKQDIIDETIANTQTFAQRLYVNETGLSEEIEERIQNLKLAQMYTDGEVEDVRNEVEAPEEFFLLDEANVDHENYDNEGYNELIVDEVLNENTTSV